MTVRKKLAFITNIALSMQFITQAYDVVSLKQEVLSIKTYIQELRQQNNPKDSAIAGWLESKILDTSNTTDNDIIAIATIANNREATSSAQIAALSKKVGYIMTYLFAITFGFAGLGSYYLYFQNERNSGWD